MTDCESDATLRVTPEEGGYKKFYGKYRGKVEDNFDPLKLGRIIAWVPDVPGSKLNFAMPCVPYAGFQEGLYAIPAIGANVWIEFEGGDPNKPIWSGCFWDELEVPLEAILDAEEVDPLDAAPRKVFKTKHVTLVLDDSDGVGGLLLSVNPPAVPTPLSISLGPTGICINAEPATITLSPEEGISIQVPSTVSIRSPVVTVDGPGL